MTFRHGQPGKWWVINTDTSALKPTYWTGGLITTEARPLVTYSRLEAAQFDSRPSAEFNWNTLAGHWPIQVRVEQLTWEEEAK